MELKTFVAESLTQICEGISEAQKNVAKLGAYISPRLASENRTANDKSVARHASKISFDVAIEVINDSTTGSSVEGGGKLNVLALCSRVTGEKTEEMHSKSSTVSRLIFDLPVIWPSVIHKPRM